MRQTVWQTLQRTPVKIEEKVKHFQPTTVNTPTQKEEQGIETNGSKARLKPSRADGVMGVCVRGRRAVARPPHHPAPALQGNTGQGSTAAQPLLTAAA